MHSQKKKRFHLRDLCIKVKTEDSIIDLSEELYINPKREIREKIWQTVNSLMVGKTKKEQWKNLSKKISISNLGICQERQRSCSKPLRVYAKLLKILNENHVDISFENIESNLQEVRWKGKIKLKLKFPILLQQIIPKVSSPVYLLLPIIYEKDISPYQTIHLKDLLCIIKTEKNRVNLAKSFFVRLNKKATEEIWNVANTLIPKRGRYDGWEMLSQLTKQHISSLKHKNARLKAKPLITYALLIKFLSKHSKRYNLSWLQKNIENMYWYKSSRAMLPPKNWADLGFGTLPSIAIRVPTVAWKEINKKPVQKFFLKHFIKRIEFDNPYIRSTRKRHQIFKKIGRKYIIDFTSKVYVHLRDHARRRLFDAFYKNVPGISLEVKMKNTVDLLDYYQVRTLTTIYHRHLQGIPLIVILKIIRYLKDKKHNLQWVERNLEGISSGERTHHKIKFPVIWNTEEGICILASLLGDGGLGYRSSLWAWAVPHYAQFRHKRLLTEYVKNVKKVFCITIRKQSKIELPAVCGYIVVASGYFVPGHKSFTNPQLPQFFSNEKQHITCLNWLISDDGCFSKNHFSIAGGSYFLNQQPLAYMVQLKQWIDNTLPEINTRVTIDKKLVYDFSITGGYYAMKKLNNLFKKHNGEIYAKRKHRLLQNYLNSRYYPSKTYEQRYARYIQLSRA